MKKKRTIPTGFETFTGSVDEPNELIKDNYIERNRDTDMPSE